MTSSANAISVKAMPASGGEANASPPALVLSSVSLAFGGLKALSEISIRIRQGERRAIIGPNGAGKTSLFNVISGEIPPTSGTLQLLGTDITALASHRRAALGLGRTYQITSIFPALSVRDNVRLAAIGCTPRKFSFFGVPDGDAAVEQTVESALESSNLSARQTANASELSYGEQRQLELALALAMNPRVLLLDEPAAGLSPAERVGMAAVIERLPRTLTILLIEHDMDLALGLVETVTCIHYGRVIAEGAPDAIRDNPLVQEVYLGRAATHA